MYYYRMSYGKYTEYSTQQNDTTTTSIGEEHLFDIALLLTFHDHLITKHVLTFAYNSLMSLGFTCLLRDRDVSREACAPL